MNVLPPPGPERSRQLIRLGVLSVALLGVVWYWSLPAGTATPSSNQSTPAVAPAAQARLPVPDALKLTSLRRQSDLPEVGRNPFVFGQRQVASAPGSSFITTPQPSGPPADIPPAMPPAPQGPPPIPLRLTGMTVVATGGRTMVTLRDPATNVLYQAFEGDIVDGRYRVVKVGLESVVMAYLDGSGQRTLALGG